MKITYEVCEKIKETIGKLPVETGGILGASPDGVIRHYLFDSASDQCPTSYTPNVDNINDVLESQWMPMNIVMTGIVHSHKDGFAWPSCGDLQYAAMILDSLDTVSSFLVPIVQCQSEYSIQWFLVERESDGKMKLRSPDMEILADNDAHVRFRVCASAASKYINKLEE